MEPFQRPLLVKLKQRPKGPEATQTSTTVTGEGEKVEQEKSPQPSPLNDLHAYNTIKARIFGDVDSDGDDHTGTVDSGSFVDTNCGTVNSNSDNNKKQKQQNIQ